MHVINSCLRPSQCVIGPMIHRGSGLKALSASLLLTSHARSRDVTIFFEWCIWASERDVTSAVSLLAPDRLLRHCMYGLSLFELIRSSSSILVIQK